MKSRIVLLAFTVAALTANSSCEQQTYEETKKFNQHVPGAHGAHGAHAADGAHGAAPAAGHGAETPAKEKRH